MTRTILLASYPKSGNTWFRMLVANLLVTDDEPVGINDLAEHCGIASARAPFDRVSLIDSGLLTHEEIDCLRPHVHKALAAESLDELAARPPQSQRLRLVKVHDAYALSPNGKPLLAGWNGAHGAILIVRDPRDVAPSLANHKSISIDHAITFMNDRRSASCGEPDRLPDQLRQRHDGWSDFVESWLNQTDFRLHLIRYEDMRADTVGVLRDATNFAGFPATDAALRRAAGYADFALMRRQEDQSGFGEAPRRVARFFRRGQVGAWRDELTAAQVARIEAAHGAMMRRLGYELAGTVALARAG